MAIPTPPPSPLSPLSSPLPQIPSPPLPLLSPPPTDPTYEEAPLGYKRSCTAHTGTYELGESSTAAAARLEEPVRDDLYRFVDTIERGKGSTPIDLEVGYGITDAWDDLTSMIYAMIEEKRDEHALERARVNRLFRDMRYHARTASLMDGEARVSHSTDCSSRTHSDLRGRQSPSTARDTRPPMLDRIDFASWQQRIRLYCRGKDNGVNIFKSIDEGPYKLGTFRETLAESTEGTPQFGPKRPRVYSDLNSEERDRYNADIRATNILLQGLPKDI
nr:integrase, catalytic region, zinc finger, CCHC-type, peptidase aspartic, catalytic [Tanacetum cinerariifolium]